MYNIINNSDFTLYEPATKEEILKVEDEFGFKLPNGYKNLLFVTNGLLTKGTISIFGTDDIIERNRTYEVQEYADGYVAIGLSDGVDFLLMHAEENTKEVIRVDCGDMNPINSELFVEDFIEWVNNGAIDPYNLQQNNQKKEELGRLILIEPPQNGARDLRKIEENFNITNRAFEILKGYRNVPFVLAENIPIDGVSEKIKSLGELGNLLQFKK
ncbi:SMI1/KNR4 family protein [Clostridium botulinum]|uniref:SMI1/KNR4 family protein n=1 Tax=Clostridium botulinum (strain Eklund 17B / Type B) TaxID=935198 RepID=B2TKT8_CLOBB|nr:SMI1/KNR4 family protein [Clostridium botulinum B str. Eklund 17B (NRP)]MBY6974569.1 SMI1/KNR4 family protein [Clostridium botulinum]MBY6999554.1 SMI1/KNR4 family protein [Clostridium botulinum]MCR1275217.1 SMI1/KNR4 family protein [Clostridium botulinum]NFD70538.1 SMI1/KNR4 family protein [Clostridium botulinum]